MSVIPLTLFFSLLLAGLFMFLFGRDQKRRRFASAESDSLLPLADELPRTVPIGPPVALDLRACLDRVPQSSPASAADHANASDSAGHDHDDHAEHGHHDHAHGANCGCKRGERPPCSGCLKRPAHPAPLSS